MSLSALAALVPAAILPFRRPLDRPDPLFWALLGVALAGPAAFSLIELTGPWKTGLSAALWLSVTASMAIFLVLAALVREAWRLAPLLVPYLILLGALGTVWSQVPVRVPAPGGLGTPVQAWLGVHIAVSLATYGLCTIAAVAASVVLLQERALKRKAPTALTHMLPSVSDAARLEFRLLVASAVVLALGIASGMAEQFLISGRILTFDHKTLLSILAFAVIGLLLILHRHTGLRGQGAARVVLLAYLLLTLAYPGVKFVTEVLIG